MVRAVHDIWAEATGPAGAKVTYDDVTATDLRDGRVPVTCSPRSGSMFRLGSTQVSCFARDAAGNIGRSTFAVVVRDRAAPMIATQDDLSAEATGPEGATVSYAIPLASDAVDGRVSATCAPASGTAFGVGSTRVTCTAKDAAGNVGRASFVVAVTDATGLVIASHANIVAEATSPGGTTLTYDTPVGTDIVDGRLPVTCSPGSGSTFPIGSTTITCSGMNAAHNIAVSSFVAIVVDTTAPALQLPGVVEASATGLTGAIVTFPATATDLVDGALPVACSPASGSMFPRGSTQVSCSARDAVGNAASASFAVAVRDSTPPVIAAHPDVTAAATGPGGSPVTYTTPLATDPDDAGLAVSCAPASGSTFGVGASRVTCRTQDPSGNPASTFFMVTVTDGSAPAVTTHANLTIEATGPGGAVVTYAPPIAADFVDGAVAVSCAPAPGSTFALGSTPVSCSAQDGAGNVGTSSFTVIVRDTTAPTVSTHADVSAEASGASGAAVTYALPAANDLVDGNVSVSCAPAPGSNFAFGSTPVVCSARDATGNAATSSFAVVVRDSAAPAIGAHANLIAEATGPSGATVAYPVPTASDVVEGSVSISCSPASGGTFGVGSTLVTCSAHDSTGNSATSSFTITVRDTTAPSVSTPGGISTEASGPSGATVTFSVAGRDIVDGGVSTACAPATGSTFGVGSTLVRCTARDATGNAGTASFSVVVQDTTAPTIIAHANVTAEATGPGGTNVTYAIPAASDLVDGGVAVACAPGSGSLFGLGSTVVTCSATDTAGNVATSSFTVVVQDTTTPFIAGHTNVVVEATGSSGALLSYSSPSATDLVDGSVTVTCSLSSGHIFPLGSTVVTCSSRDAAGNSASSSFTVDVRDTTAPTLRMPGGITVDATGPLGALVSFAASADDLLDGAVPVSCLPASRTTFALGSTVVTCSARDSAGNVALGSFTVRVVDVTPPTVANNGVLIAEATGANGTVVTYSLPSATDLVSGGVSVSCALASGSVFPIGTTLVTCTAQDGAGNTGTSSFTVSVRDTTAPTVASHANLTVEATGSTGATVTYSSPVATDLVDGNVSIICAPASGSTFALGSTSVRCSATDTAGNVDSSSFTVLVRDSIAPAITAHADVTVEATGFSGATIAYTVPGASDLVDGSVAVSCVPAFPRSFALGSTLVTCSTRDTAGNAATSSFTVTVRDTTAPVFAAHGNLTVEATSSVGATVGYVVPSASDLVDGAVSTSCLPGSGLTFALGSTVVTCTARDGAGNVATSSFTVVVRDTVAPTIAAHAGITVEATGLNGAIVSYTPPTASDVVDGSPGVSCVPASGSRFGFGSTMVACRATDSAGNVASTSFAVVVRDTTSPVIQAHANVIVEASGSSGATVTYSSPTATDAVDGNVNVSCAPTSRRVFAIGSTLVACSAQDGVGNAATSFFTVTVRDTTAPTVAVHANVTVEATGPSGASVGFTPPTASDLVNGSVAVSCVPGAGATFALGSSLVTCTATDAAGNAGSSSFAVLVHDTTAPTLAAHGNVVVAATTPSGATVTYTAPTATDLVSSVSVACSPTSGSVFPIGSTQVTCTARDAAGNTSTSTLVVVVESAAPQLSGLDTTITAMPVNNGFANSLASQVNAAINQLAQGNPAGAITDLRNVIQTLFTELNKPNPRITLQDAALVAASANQIITVLGGLTPASVLPAGEAADFALLDTISRLGTTNPTLKSLRGDAVDVGVDLVGGNVAGACASLQLIESQANAGVSQADRNILLPSVNAVRQAVGC